MSVIKFQTTVEDGNIIIPTELRNKVRGKVEITIKIKDKDREEPYDILTELMENPIKDPDFVPFKRDEIYDRKL